ncbi:uncharacterized protein EKO05_0009544 [Ascochyta rabiei]|uniref:Uncharacterized protein n=1 Tax=Didymella rabiei TaxID=5454 RepID=A0A163CLI7_DIDRA|nr:uncharacterized protein EKO05_0009544 [Ascochyta rabiei]KZM22548.1 hypothetical protein ST47_g6324 [Ascochyta rabiei]UPX19276.1 hypothetical protein EKO05_0009544 [Ascochyta rabiei]
MARLRKASPLEPSIFSRQPSQALPTRSSPRKAVREVSYVVSSDEDEENVPLRPKPSKRDHSDPSSFFQDDTFYMSKSNASPSISTLTPRKQRILRPVESNSRLLRKLSDESLASPEKRPGSERRARRERIGTQDIDMEVGRKRTLLYAKSLARSVAGRELRKASSRIDVVDSAEVWSPSKTKEKKEPAVLEIEIEAEPEEETSILCGDEGDMAQEEEQQQVETNNVEEPTVEECDSDDDEDIVLPVRSRQRRPQRCIESDLESENEGIAAADEVPKQPAAELEELEPLVSMRPPHRKGHSTISNWAQEVVDLTDSPKAPDSFILPESTRARSSSFAVSRPATSSSDGLQPFLTYSPTPTKRRSPCKAPPIPRPTTPTLAPPSPTKLVSPSKKQQHIPKAPDLRPSLDAFWNPEVVNDWNDHHSPAKPLVSPRKQQWREDVVKMMGSIDLEEESSSEEAYTSPIANPKKKTSRSQPPQKSSSDVSTPTVQQIRAQRKEFTERKHDIAASFLAELDDTICSGTISSLSQATGGIKLIWSKTLKTTAGRANWRREVIRLRTSSPGEAPTYTTETRHHCSIELASKVIDDEHRLYNVLAHEFCHLTTFMISEVRNNPHGAEFKAWGRKVSDAFRDRDVEVTTKHSYAIEYKFVWECVSCGYEFKRHSRSVDTKRHSCGKCKGALVQTKPTPRGGVVGKDGKVGEAKKSDYQIFVKANFARVKGEMAAQGLNKQMGRVMEVVAREYREKKEREKNVSKKVVDELDEALEGLKL